MKKIQDNIPAPFLFAKHFSFLFHQSGPIETLGRALLKEVDDFKYIGSHIASTEKDVQIRIANAWSALDQSEVIWKSALSEHIKKNFFRGAVELVMLYCSPARTLSKKLERKLNGSHTIMLWVVLNLNQKTHPIIRRLYRQLPGISSVIRERRTQYAGLCYRRKDKVISDVILWDPKHGTAKVGRPVKTKLLTEDIGLQLEDLHKKMDDRLFWRERVNVVRATGPI